MTDTTSTPSPALKPCPFCGGKASFKPRSFKASCDRCGAHVPVGASDSSEAITAWNTRADLADAIVQAALERAALAAEEFVVFEKHETVGESIRALASDPAEVAAIISAASQLNKAEDEINERSEEEDRG